MRMQQRRKTAADWTSTNEVLLDGEIGVESDTGKWKTGNGTTAWNSITYQPFTAGITAQINTAVAGLVNGAPGALDTLKELADALADDASFSATIAAQLALKAPLASPTFTGTVSGITKSMVGLGNVDNTADTAKPVSTAQQTALDLKAPLASPALTGTPTVPTATAGTSTTQAASTAFVTTSFVTATVDGSGGVTLYLNGVEL
jgi:hypothetical protein